MSKKKIRGKKKPSHRPSTGRKKLHFPKLPLFARQMLILGGWVTLFILLVNFNAGYHWLYHKLLIDNIEKNLKFKDKTYQEKMELKLGFSGKYLNFLKENTQEDAVIIMPPDSAFHPKGAKSPFNNFITRKTWAHYFVYPRKLIYYKDKDKYPQLYKKATHIAVVNYWGYQLTPSLQGQKQQYSIIALGNTKSDKQ